MKSRLLFTLCFLTLCAVLYSQEIPENTEKRENSQALDGKSAPEDELTEEKEPAGGRLTPAESQRAELEIKASTMPELAVWCRSLGLSESGTKEELAKRIREHFGLPGPKKILIRMKVEHAINLMRNSGFNIREIATLSGFTEEKRMAECFHRMFGIPPGAYRFKNIIGLRA